MSSKIRTCAGCGATLHPFADHCEACGKKVAEHVPFWAYVVAGLISLGLISLVVDPDMVIRLLMALPNIFMRLGSGGEEG